MSIKKSDWNTVHLFTYCSCCFCTNYKGWVEWLQQIPYMPPKPKIFNIWPLTESFLTPELLWIMLKIRLVGISCFISYSLPCPALSRLSKPEFTWMSVFVTLVDVSTMDSASRNSWSQGCFRKSCSDKKRTKFLSIPGMAVEDTVAAKLVYDSWSSGK